jgi:4-hydroxy-tetrahydrodipicolinate reductase
MKYAIIGNGKTGQVVQNSLPRHDIVAVCNIDNPLTKEKIEGADVGIVFVPGNVMGDLMPTLFESKIPMVIGTTRYAWPKDLDQKLKNLKTPWVIGQNFSIALNVMRSFSVRIKEAMNTLRPGQLHLGITETHHKHKLDAPSGTSIFIAKALDFPKADIRSIREGEVKGMHTVSFDWPYDRLLLTHETLDRAAYAEGVILACEHAPRLAPGLHLFETLADELIAKGKAS